MARNFNGSTDYATISDDAALSLPSGDWSISIKVRLTNNDGTSTHYPFSYGPAFSANSINFWFWQASHSTKPNQAGLKVIDGTPDTLQIESGSDTPGTRRDWMTFFFIKSGTSMDLYEENTSIATGDATSIGEINPSSGDLNLGRRQDNSRFIGADLADFAKWDRALTSGERQSIADGAHITRFPESLIANLPLYGNGSQEPDLSGNLHNATLSGTSFATHAPSQSISSLYWSSMSGADAAPPTGEGFPFQRYYQQGAAV